MYMYYKNCNYFFK